MINLLHGDCLELMKTIPDKSIDLVLTDPPYGINLKYDQYEDSENNWYDLMNKVLPEIIRISKMAILPSCQIKRLEWIYKNYPPNWLMCWYKGSTGHASYIGFNDWEPHLVYGRRLNNQYMHDYFQSKPSPKLNTFGHPCPKPIEWAEWIITRVARNDKITILDCFMGSGTTGVVAKQLGHNYIGMELSKKYFDIATERINNG
jgi:site-specific DNA-methyltransferase (adenine-specific)